MTCISRALIIGGGIGGMSAALALARHGVHCDVVELNDTPLGAALTLYGRPLEALDELGVYTQLFDAGRPYQTDLPAASLHDAAGQLIAAPPPRLNWPGAKEGFSLYRPIFVSVLADHAQALNVDIRTGITAERIDDGKDDADPVTVTFTDGTQSHYDLIVGADGIGSHTRTTVFANSPTPTYAGQLSIRWMAPGPAIPAEGWYLSDAGRLWMYHMPGLDQIYVPANITMPVWHRPTAAEVFAIFARLLDSFTAPAVVELRGRLTANSQLIARPFEYLLQPTPWYRGKTVLIGDAAHGTTAHLGTGAGMAVEDAVVLAECVSAANSLTDALDAFMTRRWSRIKSVVDASVELSRLQQTGAHPSHSAELLRSAHHALAQPY